MSLVIEWLPWLQWLGWLEYFQLNILCVYCDRVTAVTWVTGETETRNEYTARLKNCIGWVQKSLLWNSAEFELVIIKYLFVIYFPRCFKIDWFSGSQNLNGLCPTKTQKQIRNVVISRAKTRSKTSLHIFHEFFKRSRTRLRTDTKLEKVLFAWKR